MSTQRRANRTTAAIEIDRADVRRRWFRGCMERAGISVSAARTGSALASHITAPLVSIIWLAWAWFSIPATRVRQRGPRSRRRTAAGGKPSRVATNSLLSDHCNEVFAGPGSLFGSPPRDGAGGCRLPVPQATPRSSLSRIPILPVRTRLRPTLPKAPAGEVCWAERYDGKRDLYFPARPHETRLAIPEDDQLAEIYYERENEYTPGGNDLQRTANTHVLPGNSIGICRPWTGAGCPSCTSTRLHGVGRPGRDGRA